MQKKQYENGEYEMRGSKLFFRKVEGFSDFISAVICIFAMVAFFVAMIYAFHGMVARDEVERINRKYLLSMEREGYLSPAYQSALTNELTSMGATSINLTGTSMSPVGYGNTVVLHIECDITVFSLNSSFERQGGVKHIVVEKTGTALY